VLSVISVTKTVVNIAGLGLIVWTLRYLGSGDKKDPVYRFGVRQFGILSWITSTCIGTYFAWLIAPQRHSLLYLITLFGVLMLPICLWGGYLWGKVMSAFFPKLK
jgi:hypothetical protein